MPLIEIVAAIFGLLCVLFCVLRSVWTWPTGLVQVVLYIFVFWNARLYADMALHVVYVVLQFYGWWAWVTSRDVSSAAKRIGHPDQPNEELGPKDSTMIVVRRLTTQRILWCCVVTLVMTGAFAWGLAGWTNADLPLPDSFIAAASLVAQYLMAARYLENWVFWVIVDTVGVWLYAYKGLTFTAGLYAVFWVMAIAGHISWWRNYRAQTSVESGSP